MTKHPADQLGERGHTFISSKNRLLARKWAVENGVSSAWIARQGNANLAAIYNDTTDHWLAQARNGVAKYQKYTNETDETSEQQSDNSAANATNETAAAPVAPVVSSPSNDVAAAAQLIEILRKSGGVDETAVNALIDRRLDKLPELIREHATVTRIEIKQHAGSTYAVDGHAHPKLALLIKAMASRQANGWHPNIMLVGPTGSGKTHGVEQAAKALGLEFYTNGAISMDHQLIGFKDAAGNYHETPLRKAFGRPAVYLFDEIDSSDNSPLLALAGALANGSFEFPDALVERHPDSVIIAAGNTWGNGATAEFVGRNKLDGAIRSRFPVRIPWDYDEKLEREISGNLDWTLRVQKARANARRAGLKVTIDPRMSQAGAALIAAGMSADEAAELTYLADLTADQRGMVEAV